MGRQAMAEATGLRRDAVRARKEAAGGGPDRGRHLAGVALAREARESGRDRLSGGAESPSRIAGDGAGTPHNPQMCIEMARE